MLTEYSITKRRIVFSRGDFIKYGKHNRLAKVKEICLYEHMDLSPPGRRLFVLVSPVKPTRSLNPLLRLPTVEYSGKQDFLLGLPKIHVRKLYMI